MPSPVHEGLGFGAIEPDRIQGDAALPHASNTAQSGITFQPPLPQPIAPTRNAGAVLAAVKAAARRLRRWPTASLDRGCARRSGQITVGTKKRLGRTKKLNLTI